MQFLRYFVAIKVKLFICFDELNGVVERNSSFSIESGFNKPLCCITIAHKVDMVLTVALPGNPVKQS